MKKKTKTKNFTEMMKILNQLFVQFFNINQLIKYQEKNN